MDNFQVPIKKIALNALAVVGIAILAVVGWQWYQGGYGSLPLYEQGGFDTAGFAETVSILNPESYDASGERTALVKRTSPQVASGVEAGIEDRKVIKNGNLSILVENAEEATNMVAELADDFDGVVANKEVYEAREGVKIGRVTINVPSDKFAEAVKAIKEVALKVERETINARDVTEEFIDLEARLKNLKAEESQYLRIMNTAKTVEDTLKVSQRLYDVRGRIESLEGRIKYLSRQIDFSSISVVLTAEADVEVLGLRWRPLMVAKFAVRDMLEGLTSYVDAVIKFIIFLPVLIIWLLTLFVVGVGLKRLMVRLREKLSAKKETQSNEDIIEP